MKSLAKISRLAELLGSSWRVGKEREFVQELSARDYANSLINPINLKPILCQFVTNSHCSKFAMLIPKHFNINQPFALIVLSID